ncbi:MAG: tryptophan synthase subunit alpha [Anaerolineales bacterium]|nr:tryptophan synthase subunit alpha [Anaerolineales bacterium]
MALETRMSDVFEKKRAALMPYFTIGYPDFDISLDVIAACVDAGADLMELGMPFSDPLADGPTIQHSTQVALENGITVKRCLEAVRELRARGVTIPLILMGYINPVLAYGLDRFVTDAAKVGASGFIIPDLPPEEAGDMQTLCQVNGLDLIFLLPPNSSNERVRFVTGQCGGFVYLVSVLGITGERDALPVGLSEFVQRVRSQTNKPLAVGFGISTPEQAANVGQIADGVIVGSALIKVAGQASDPVRAAREFVAGLKQALREGERG